VTMDLDVRNEVFPDFLERLQDDLYLATGHKADNFRIKAVLPDDVHSGRILETSACAFADLCVYYCSTYYKAVRVI
jgi:hypothetical protein